MSFLNSPKVLLFSRLVQLVFAIAFLIVIAWCNTHKANWIYLDGPVALGVIATIFTLFITAHGVYTHWRTDFVKIHGKFYLILRMALDFLLFLMWIGTATLMLRPRSVDYSVPIPPFPPDVPWAIGIAFSFVEIVFFILTMFLVFKEHRSGHKTSPSAAYV